MARKTPTEADLGIAATEEEMAAPPVVDDDIPLDNDPIEEPPKAEPEKTAEPEKVADKTPEEPKTVDVRALQEARSEAREAKRQAAVLEERWNAFLAGQNKPQEPAQPEMPGDNDPMGRLNYVFNELQGMKNARAEQETQTKAQTQEQERFREAYNRVNHDFSSAAAADPTLNEALASLRQSVSREYQAMGVPAHLVEQQVRQVENTHIAYIAQNGLDPAQYIKGLAGARGWAPQAQTPTPATTPAQPDLKALQATQQRHQSLSDAAGGAAPAPLDAKAIAKMDDKTFNAWMKSRGNDEKLREILGG
jgi:hypothetical protein